MTPDDGLGKSGRASGARDVHVIATAAGKPSLTGLLAQRGLVVGRAIGDRRVGAIVDDEQVPYCRQPISHRRDDRRKRTMEDQRDEVGVAVELLELVLDVP